MFFDACRCRKTAAHFCVTCISLDSTADFLSRPLEFRDEFSFAKADQDAEASLRQEL